MGQCCSTPAADDAAATVQHTHDAASGEMLGHALATVHTSPSTAAAATTAQQHHRHVHHRGRSRSGSAPKQLLRAASPPLELQQQQQGTQPYGLSPRSYHQLQLLLPTAPLQHLAAQDTQHPRSKDTAALLTHSSSGFLGARAAAGHSTTDQHVPAVLLSLQQLHSASSGSSTPRSTASAHHAPARTNGQQLSNKTPADALSPAQVLAVCAAVVQEDAAFQAAGVTPLMLASLCLIESGGRTHAKQHQEQCGDTSHGLCQVLLSTAQWLASSQGFDRHGSSLTVEDLQQPKICVYFAAAYLSVLSNYGGSARTEGFVARAYHAGPKGVDTAAARIFLQKYLKAKHWLTEVAKAMAVTVAAAALAAGVALPPAAAAAVTGAAAAAGAAAVAGGTEVPLGAAHAKVLALADTAAAGAAPDKTDQACKDQNISSSAGSTAADASGPDSSSIPGVSTGDHDSSTNSSSCGSRQVLVRRGTADLLTALCSSWEDVQQATGKGMPAAPDSSSAAGSILAHMLPSRWGLSSSRQQQQQHGQHIRPGSSSGSNSGGAAGEGPLALVSVDAADLCTAWLRLLCTSPVVARVALGQAAAAMALAPFPSEDWQIASAPAAAAAESDAAAAGSALGSSGSDGGRSAASRLGLIGGHSSSGRARSSGTAAAAGPAAAAAAAAGAQVEAMPCVMHVVGHGETLQRIAAVCNLGVPDLLAANPEVTAADTVHHNDCIAVPLPAVFPRLYVIQPGDTLHSIARAHEVPLGRVLAKNPELTDPSRVQPGWVVALPGLKGDSQVALPADWLLTQVSPPSAQGPYQQQQQQAAWGLQVQAYPGVVADAEAQLHTSADRGLHQQQGMAAAGQQQGLIAATSQQRQGSRHHRSRLKPGSSSGRSQQQQQCVPPVGSGAFLFTVGAGTAGAGSSSSSAGTAVSTSSRAVGVSQRIGKRSGSRKHTNRDSSTATPAGRTMDLAAAQLGDGRD